MVDVDEPPDNCVYFSCSSTPLTNDLLTNDSYFKLPPSNGDRKASLLTQALLTSPDVKLASRPPISPMSRATSTASNYSTASAVSTAELTSDGGLTSPARTSTPSPPKPSMTYGGLMVTTSKPSVHHIKEAMDSSLPNGSGERPAATASCNTLGASTVRKRCITFALSPVAPTPAQHNLQYRDSQPMSKNSSSTETEVLSSTAKVLHPIPQQVKHKPEGIRFHEFASIYPEEDEWLYEQPIQRHKITVNDTLRKENAIRKLGEEAEDEALDEEIAEEAEFEAESVELATDNDSLNDDGDEEEDGGDDGEHGSEDEVSDAGNETDDEGGFADSDNETDVDLEYQFWTPGLTPAATTTDYIEHIRPKTQRTGSQSSIESTDNFNAITIQQSGCGRGRRNNQRRKMLPKMRPGTPDLPDSTDFVCGTLDEDRPLEAAYLSCLEQKRIARHSVIPQDFDPSFPTSDMDEQDEDEDENEAEEGSDEHMWVTGRPDDSDADDVFRRQKGMPKKNAKSPAPSPKRFRSPPAPKGGGRMKSPPPPRYRTNHRSPPPRRLFGGQSPRRMRSPLPPYLRNLNSPPSSRRLSASSAAEKEASGIDLRHLAQRPNLTHTKSLPRTPNPFWKEHRRCRSKAVPRADTEHSSKLGCNLNGEMHSRGPIDIVQGLENKRQRRKEKFWRQHCRNAGKEKERRCQPGKGAERMRELGLEMAGKSKAYGQRGQLVLSV